MYQNTPSAFKPDLADNRSTDPVGGMAPVLMVVPSRTPPPLVTVVGLGGGEVLSGSCRPSAFFYGLTLRRLARGDSGRIGKQ